MLYLRGVVMGLAIAAPVGPIGLLCIRQTLNAGWRSGLLTGLGAATADGLYGAIAAFGLTAISAVLVDHQRALGLVGGLFLLYLGITTARTPIATQAAAVKATTLVQNYVTAVGLTLTNPATILSFIAIFAGLGLAAEAGDDRGAALLLVAGVFTGSALWWLLLSGGISLVRHRLSDCGMVWINRVAGGVIVGFGLVAIGTVFTSPA